MERLARTHFARAVMDWWPKNLRQRLFRDGIVLGAGLLLAAWRGWGAAVREELAIVIYGALALMGTELVRFLWHLYRAPFRQRDEARKEIDGLKKRTGGGFQAHATGTVFRVVARQQESPDIRRLESHLSNQILSFGANQDTGRTLSAIHIVQPVDEVIHQGDLPRQIYLMQLSVKERVFRFLENQSRPKFTVQSFNGHNVTMSGAGFIEECPIVIDLYYEPDGTSELRGPEQSVVIGGAVAEAKAEANPRVQPTGRPGS